MLPLAMLFIASGFLWTGGLRWIVVSVVNDGISRAETEDGASSARPNLLRVRGIALPVLLFAALLFIVGRSWSGELGKPLSGGTFLLTVVSVAIVAAWMRWPAVSRLRRTETISKLPPWPGWMDEVAAWAWENQIGLSRVSEQLVGGALTSAGLLVVLSLVGTNAAALIVGWLIVFGSETLLWVFACGWKRASGSTSQVLRASANQEADWDVPSASSLSVPAEDRTSLPVAEDLPFEGVAWDGESESELDDGGADVLPPDVVQQTTRTALPQGGESIEAFLRCRPGKSETLQVVHVSFCPPLNDQPELEVAQLSGPEAAIKVTLAERFGARLEVRMEQPASDGADCVLRLHAVG